MSVDTQLSPPEAEPTVIDRLYRLSVDQYHQMAQAGILKDNERVELLEGLLVTKMTKNERHIAAVWLANRALSRVVPTGWYVGQDHPVVIQPRDEPEPDLSVVRGEIRDYLDRKPGPGDLALVVEVSDTSYAYDHTRKLARYARAEIAHYWIIDVKRNLVEVYAEPTGPGDAEFYRLIRIFGLADEIPLILDGQEVARVPVRDLLP